MWHCQAFWYLKYAHTIARAMHMHNMQIPTPNNIIHTLQLSCTGCTHIYLASPCTCLYSSFLQIHQIVNLEISPDSECQQATVFVKSKIGALWWECVCVCVRAVEWGGGIWGFETPHCVWETTSLLPSHPPPPKEKNSSFPPQSILLWHHYQTLIKCQTCPPNFYNSLILPPQGHNYV